MNRVPWALPSNLIWYCNYANTWVLFKVHNFCAFVLYVYLCLSQTGKTYMEKRTVLCVVHKHMEHCALCLHAIFCCLLLCLPLQIGTRCWAISVCKLWSTYVLCSAWRHNGRICPLNDPWVPERQLLKLWDKLSEAEVSFAVKLKAGFALCCEG